MLHLLSGIQVQLQFFPPSPFFPHSHGLSDSDMEGVAILKVGQSAHLTSFPQHSSLPLPVESFDWCPFEKRALGLMGGVQRGRGDQSCLSAA